MTISNNNLQSLITLSPEMSADSTGGIQAMAISAEAESQSGSAETGEFWSMLSQQLTEITAQNDTQVIENKELLAIFNEFEAELELAGNNEDLSAKWMQIVNAQVLDEGTAVAPMMPSELVDDAGIESVELAPGALDPTNEPMAMPLLAVTQLATAEPVAVAANGNNLPRMRQIAAAEMPVPMQDNTALKAPELKTQDQASELLKQMPNSDEPLSETRLAPESQLKANDLQIDKILIKQAGLEPQISSQSRESGLNLVTPLPTAALNPAQTLSSNQLPTALQTLQLAPQAAPTEWGNAIGERVSFLINHKLERAEIRIDPPHLGKLDIQIQLKEDSALVTINTQQASTRDLIDSASYRLREFLQEAGYNSVDVNVSHQQQSMSEQGFDGQGQNSLSGEAESDETAAGAPVTEGQSVEMMLSMEPGRIDYFA